MSKGCMGSHCPSNERRARDSSRARVFWWNTVTDFSRREDSIVHDLRQNKPIPRGSSGLALPLAVMRVLLTGDLVNSLRFLFGHCAVDAIRRLTGLADAGHSAGLRQS